MSAHDHDHGPAGHSHAPKDFGRAFLIGTILNIGFVLAEAWFGIVANSMALLADAGHNLSDVLGLLVAWAAAVLAKRAPSRTYTYGLRRSSILAALFNAVFLLVAIGAIAIEAIQRFANPQPVASATVMIVAGIGILINGATALLFASGRTGDLNIRGAYLHMAADAGVSAAVVVAGLVISVTGWQWIDPATSLIVVIVILIGTWGLLRDSVAMSLDRVPSGIDPLAVESALTALPSVQRVHDLHIWPLSTTDVALSCHVEIMARQPADDDVLSAASAMLEVQFGITHTTIQLELGEFDCEQAKPGSL